jgi:alpha-N-acetylglucosamine transferase
MPKTKMSKICKLYDNKTSRTLLQDEFDVCVRLDEEWMKFDRATMEMYSKSYCWSMVKWNKVAFVDVNCMVKCQLDILFWLKRYSAAKS